MRIVNWSSLLFALLQSACSALIAISGLRVAIGLGSLAAAAGINAPARGFHRDAIRIPMMALSLAGALITLYILWHIRRLRNRPAARWRVKPLTARQIKSNVCNSRFQFLP
jgi:TRAP-type C4-dicarboxylate transport system permease small subunit